MKKMIALLLALTMMLSLGAPVLAADESETAPDRESYSEQPETTASPEPEATASPEPEATASPEPEETASPEPEATASPESEATASPEPEETVSPEPEASASPEPEETASPEPEASASPEPEATASPEPEATVSPEPEVFAAVGDVPEVPGRMVVSILQAMDFGSEPLSFTVTLGQGEPQVLSVGKDGANCRFDALAAGEYVLTVRGDGFAAYTQSIHVGRSEGVAVQLTVGRMAGYDDPAGAHPGVLLVGDVNGDGAVDEQDRLPMMQAVAGESSAVHADLNRDGKVDLADAEYLAKGLAAARLDAALLSATVERFVPQEAIWPEVSDATSVTGDVADLLRDNGQKVGLGHSDGEAISAAAPVAVSFGVPDGAASDTILFEDTNIAAGEVLVEYIDAAGVTHLARGVIGEPVAEMPAQAAEPVYEIGVLDTPAPDTAGEIIDLPLVPAANLPSAGIRYATDPGISVMAVPEETVQVTEDANGNIVVDLGEQKAVKRVTLTITATTDDLDLAEISQVEFVNGMENRIPEPALDRPTIHVSEPPASRQFTISWSECVNITGYEVEVSAEGCAPESYSLAGTTLTVTRYNNDEVRNYTQYTIRVRSVNGSWSSDWSDPAYATPLPSGRPDKPDNVKATGGYQSITVSWKNMKDTVSYDLYYKEESAQDYEKIPDLKVTNYTITGLDSSKPTTYEVYVVGKNEFGDSDPSMHASAATVTLAAPDMPRFNLINRDADGRPGTSHITSAVIPNTSGVMVSSPLDPDPGTAWGTVDGDAASYYERMTWDDGGYNNLSDSVGLIYTFDAPYTMDTIGMMSAVDANMDYTYLKIRWWDAGGAEHYIDRTQMTSERRTDSSGKDYFFLRLPEPVEAVKIQIGVARYWAGNNCVNVSEVYFYRYDTLKQELRQLYADDLHTVLVDTVTAEQLDSLEARINASVDEFGEVNPDKDQLLRELDTARKIYNDQFLGRVIRIHTGITASGDEHGFGGLNAWQPLGVTAAAGESITIYVGNNALKTGSTTALQLVATQYHAESSAMSKMVMTLRVGANEIRVPKIWTNTGMESGGALYIQYTGGANSSDNYAVRVSGGTPVPVLDLYRVTDEAERASRVSAYLAELQTYVSGMQALHDSVHKGSGNGEVDYDFVPNDCILGATDIMLDTMMLSLPAQQVVSGCGGSAQTLLTSLDAMEDMMALFYQHKGLNAAAPGAADRIPNRHLNIRYQRMFSGAFMYASGDHIGIEWPETAGMVSCAGVQADGSGLYQSGNYFGWGIAHEIGHDINQGVYAIAEITNNYFAVLAQARDTNDSVRFDYEKVYEKVTSGTKGSAGNVFTQLGMYWQLHLAYDKGYNFRTYADYDEQLANLFWARVDTYARTPSKAPGGLTLEGADREQALMRLCCAAAERDILEFFQRWGKTPDETTVAYASQFEKETRAIYYVCDDARRYTIEHPQGSSLDAGGTTSAVGTVTVATDPDQANRVVLTLGHSDAISDAEVLGYEIVRCTIAAGKVERRTVGFATTDTFEDVVSAMNNRAVYYEITLVDQYLNRSATVATGTVKIQHEGDLAKNGWTVVTDGLTADPSDIGSSGGDEDMPEVMEEDVALRMADDKVDTVYRGTVGEGACIEVDFGQTHVITGFRYTAGSGTPIAGYTVEVRQDGQWVRAAEGTLDGDRTVYFSNADGKYVSTYSADAMRLALTGQTGEMISVAELDALGLTGDNVDFRRTDETGQAAIGYLSADYRYGSAPEDVIPARSLVFTGSYKGNAAYNVVVLYDQDGRIVAGTSADGSLTAYQTILADLPDTGNIQDVTDGVWIYWIQPEDMTGEFTLPQKVRAELYRVNDAQTNEGQRLVSDSLFVDVPSPLGDITLGGGSVG